MEEKKKRLLELTELLNFPLDPQESKKQAETLTEEELNALLEVYEGAYEHKKALVDMAKTANPEAYKKIEDKYHEDMLNAELEYDDKLEGVQKQADDKLDETDQKSDEKIEAISSDIKKKLQEAEDISEDLSLGFKDLPSESS